MAVPKVVPARKHERFEIVGTGDDFVDRGQYYLHDKDGARTSNRVAFTHTENLPTDDPQQALKFMNHTAAHAAELKAQAGKAKTGRKRQRDAVYIYSLSWHPEEKVTKEEMIDAAKQTLKALRMQDREALIVAHNDEPHPHLHIIINRISAENGIAASLWNDWIKLSRWAEKYEKQRGKIYCPQRVANNNRRDKGEFVKYRPQFNTPDYRRWKRMQDEELRLRGPVFDLNIPEIHRAQRQQLYAAKEKRILQRRQQIREIARPKWAFIYRQQKAEALELDKTRKSAFKRLMYWLSHRKEMNARGGLRGAFEALIGYPFPDFQQAMDKRHVAARKALARNVNKQIREVFAEENEQFRIDLEHLKQTQQIERQHLQDIAMEAEWVKDVEEEQRTRAAGDAGDAANDEDYRRTIAEEKRADSREKPVKEQFLERVRKRAKRARKRDKRGKGKGREHDHEE